MKQMGVSILSEPNNGTQNGAFVAPSSLSAANQSRSDARVAYFDTALDRPNLHLATEQMVTQILLAQEGTQLPNSSTPQLQTAIGVEVSTPGPVLGPYHSWEQWAY